jgi:hypothetical protein
MPVAEPWIGRLVQKYATSLDNTYVRRVELVIHFSTVVLANSSLADIVGVAHCPSIPADSRVIGIAGVHAVCFPNSSVIAASDPASPSSVWRAATFGEVAQTESVRPVPVAWFIGAWAEWRSDLCIVKPPDEFGSPSSRSCCQLGPDRNSGSRRPFSPLGNSENRCPSGRL